MECREETKVLGTAANMDGRRARQDNRQRDGPRKKQHKQQQQQQQQKEQKEQKQAIVQRKRQALTPQSSIDEALAPSLAHEALNLQTKEAFQDFLLHYFPNMNASVASRVEVNWMDFVRGPTPLPPAVMWGLRALVTYQMGAMGKQSESENENQNGNENVLLTARHMYTRGIQHLACMLGTPAALTDSTLAAAIILSMFEVMDGSCEGSWLAHAQGIRHIISARGPGAHKKGMGRNLLLSYRPFLIGEAFVRCEPCILGRPEWTAIFEDVDIAPEDGESKTNSSRSPLGQTIDYAFNESAKCPGYYAATHEIITSWPAFHNSRSLSQSLMDDMGRTRCSLLRLQDCLDQGFCKSGTELQLLEGFAGPIPSARVASLVKMSSEGISAAVALLDQLITLLRSHLHRVFSHQVGYTQDVYAASTENPWAAVTNRLRTTGGARLEEPDACPMDGQLDRFSVSMGMLSIY